MTKTSYEVEGHDYTENTPCDAPATCTNPEHWRTDDEATDLETAREYAAMNDAPAVRIVKIVRTVTREVIG